MKEIIDSEGRINFTRESIWEKIESDIKGYSNQNTKGSKNIRKFFNLYKLSEKFMVSKLKKEKNKLDVYLYKMSLKPINKNDKLNVILLKREFPLLNEKFRNCLGNKDFHLLVADMDKNSDTISKFLTQNTDNGNFKIRCLDFNGLAKLLQKNHAVLLFIEKHLDKEDSFAIDKKYFDDYVKPFINEVLKFNI